MERQVIPRARINAKYLSPIGHLAPKFVYGRVDAVALEVLSESYEFDAIVTASPWLMFDVFGAAYMYEVHYRQIIKSTTIDNYLYY